MNNIEIKKTLEKYKEFIDENQDDASSIEVRRWEIVVEALEKQVAIDVIKTPYFYGEISSCPNCGNDNLTNLFNDKPNHCLKCGKKLKW